MAVSDHSAEFASLTKEITEVGDAVRAIRNLDTGKINTESYTFSEMKNIIQDHVKNEFSERVLNNYGYGYNEDGARHAVACARNWWLNCTTGKAKIYYLNGKISLHNDEAFPFINDVGSESNVGVMDCSTFIMLVLAGIRYEESPYYDNRNKTAGFKYNGWESLTAKNNYDWIIPDIFQDDFLKNFAYKSTNKEETPLRYTAAQLCEYFYKKGRVFFPKDSDFEEKKVYNDDGTLKEILNVPTLDFCKNVLRPGDIVFHQKYKKTSEEKDKNGRFLEVTHISIVDENTQRYFNATDVDKKRAVVRTNYDTRGDIICYARPTYVNTSSKTVKPPEVNYLAMPYALFNDNDVTTRGGILWKLFYNGESITNITPSNANFPNGTSKNTLNKPTIDYPILSATNGCPANDNPIYFWYSGEWEDKSSFNGSNLFEASNGIYLPPGTYKFDSIYNEDNFKPYNGVANIGNTEDKYYQPRLDITKSSVNGKDIKFDVCGYSSVDVDAKYSSRPSQSNTLQYTLLENAGYNKDTAVRIVEKGWGTTFTVPPDKNGNGMAVKIFSVYYLGATGGDKNYNPRILRPALIRTGTTSTVNLINNKTGVKLSIPLYKVTTKLPVDNSAFSPIKSEEINVFYINENEEIMNVLPSIVDDIVTFNVPKEFYINYNAVSINVNNNSTLGCDFKLDNLESELAYGREEDFISGSELLTINPVYKCKVIDTTLPINFSFTPTLK